MCAGVLMIFGVINSALTLIPDFVTGLNHNSFSYIATPCCFLSVSGAGKITLRKVSRDEANESTAHEVPEGQDDMREPMMTLEKIMKIEIGDMIVF